MTYDIILHNHSHRENINPFDVRSRCLSSNSSLAACRGSSSKREAAGLGEETWNMLMEWHGVSENADSEFILKYFHQKETNKPHLASFLRLYYNGLFGSSERIFRFKRSSILTQVMSPAAQEACSASGIDKFIVSCHRFGLPVFFLHPPKGHQRGFPQISAQKLRGAHGVAIRWSVTCFSFSTFKSFVNILMYTYMYILYLYVYTMKLYLYIILSLLFNFDAKGLLRILTTLKLI